MRVAGNYQLRNAAWLIAGSIYAIYQGLHWGRWQDLARWTRLVASVEVSTGLLMLLGAIVVLAMQNPGRMLTAISALGPAALGLTLIAGTALGAIPCTGGS